MEKNYNDLYSKKHSYKNQMIGYLITAIILTIHVALLQELWMDHYMDQLISATLREGAVAVTQFPVMVADTEVIIVLSIGIMAVLVGIGWRNWAFFYFRLMFFGSLLAYLLKQLIARPRPNELISINLWQLGTETISQSFPSGHVMKITFLIVFLVVLYMVEMKGAVSLKILGLGGVIVIMVGLGQILNGRHFFTDVIGGYTWALAWAYGNLYIESLRKDKGIFSKKNTKIFLGLSDDYYPEGH